MGMIARRVLQRFLLAYQAPFRVNVDEVVPSSTFKSYGLSVYVSGDWMSLGRDRDHHLIRQIAEHVLHDPKFKSEVAKMPGHLPVPKHYGDFNNWSLDDGYATLTMSVERDGWRDED